LIKKPKREVNYIQKGGQIFAGNVNRQGGDGEGKEGTHVNKAGKEVK